MYKLLLPIFLVCFLKVVYASETTKPVLDNEYSTLVKNTVEQLDYLIDFNENESNNYTKKNNRWYIYIAGAPIDSLKYYMAETVHSFSANYLKELNDSLVKVNSHNNTAVYVAFTDYEHKILSPVFPPSTASLVEKEAHIKKLLNQNNSSDYSPNQLDKIKDDFDLFSKSFRKLILDVYNSSKISKISKANIFMPFSNYSIREVIQKTGEYKLRKSHAYTLYIPKKEEDFNKGKLKAIYNSIESQTGSSKSEKKISAIVSAINRYFHGALFEYRECQELLAKYRNKPIMTEFPEFRKHAENNPCILRYVVPWGEDIEKSEWMMMTEKLIVIPLYAALAVPAASVAGAEGLRQLTKKKIQDAAMAAAMNIGTQTIINFYFGEEEILNEKDIEVRWKKALFALDVGEFSVDVAESVFELNTRQMVALNCIQDGVVIENIDWNNIDISKATIKINLRGCVEGVIRYLLIDKIQDQTLGYLLKKLKKLATKDPKLFVKAWRELYEDLGVNFKSDFKKGYQTYKKDILDASGISSLNQKINQYINASFDVENAIGEAVEEYAKEMSGTATSVFKNTIEDAAIETDILIKESTNIAFADGVRRTIKKQGANVSLDFSINGQNVRIRATLLEKLDDDTYKIVFVNPPGSGTSTVEGFINNTTKGRKDVIKALQNNQSNFIPTAKGANAGKLQIDGKPITITEIELRTQKTDGEFDKKTVVKNSNSAEGIIKKSVKIANVDDIGKASISQFSLLDETGNVTGELKRVIGKGGKEVRYFYTDFKGGNGLIKNQKYKMSPSYIPNYEILDVKLLDNFDNLSIKDILYGDLQMPKVVNDNVSGLGKIMSEDAYKLLDDKVDIDGLYGLWKKDPNLYADYGGESINLTKFKNALKNGMTETEAAFETVTGKVAKKKGFNKVQFSKDFNINNLDEVHLIFLK